MKKIKKGKVENIRQFLENNGVQPSYHRIRIFQYLQEKKNHPTADIIYNELSGEIPTLSKTTVYNTLNLFINKGIAKALTINENEIRYDYNMEQHGHFKCVRCGKIYDIIMKCCKSCNKQYINGHKFLECHSYFKGICRDCLKRK